jgi:hypothetical protein
VGNVTAPVWRVIWLDATVLAADRRALKRAFDDASMYSDDSRIAAAPLHRQQLPRIAASPSRAPQPLRGAF